MTALRANVNFSRDPALYAEWRKNVDSASYRDYAIQREKHDIDEAIKYMQKAYDCRPEGLFLKKKIEEYELIVGRIN